MVFSSVSFIFVFLPITLGIYYLLKGKFKNLWLLFASLLFYAFGGIAFLPIMLFSIFLNYIGGLTVAKAKSARNKKILLAFFVIANILTLSYWKYFNFFVSVTESILHTQLEFNEVSLPIGISFFTFQGMSYVIDCYRGKVNPNKNIVAIALYISMFPQLIAGPIVRYQDICDQLESRMITIDDAASGLRRFIIGFAKKIILANTLGLLVDPIYDIAPSHSRITVLWLCMFCYALQLYYDFTGYSDMAIGIGKMLGFTFPENFDYPYMSKSYAEYWRRWHMTLGTWFKEYVYIPLGGNRKSKFRTYLNIFFVWFLTGFWHGAGWTYLCWGLLIGIIIIIEKLTSFPKKLGILAHPYTIFMWSFALIFFRSPTINYAIEFIASMFGFIPRSQVGFELSWYLDKYYILIIICAMLGVTPYVKKIWSKAISRFNSPAQAFLSNTVALIMFVISCMYLMTSTYNPFIYFQF